MTVFVDLRILYSSIAQNSQNEGTLEHVTVCDCVCCVMCTVYLNDTYINNSSLCCLGEELSESLFSQK